MKSKNPRLQKKKPLEESIPVSRFQPEAGAVIKKKPTVLEKKQKKDNP
jgi:hypothetical protein